MGAEMKEIIVHSRVYTTALAIGLGVICFWFTPKVSATTLSAGVVQKLTVYQGVVVIAPGGGKILELGNEGQDIVSTDSIYLRPNSLTEANGARVVKNGTKANLYVNELCLSGSGSTVCHTVVPTPAGGDSTWTQNVGGFTTLSPTNADTGVLVGTYTSPIANRTALTLTSTWAGPALTVNGIIATGWYSPGADPAGSPSTISYDGYKNVWINGGNLAVATSDAYGLRVWSEELKGVDFAVPWHAGNDGIFNHSESGTAGPDTESFDSDTAMPFLLSGTKAKYTWLNVVAINTYLDPPLREIIDEYNAICVETPYDKLCVHGNQSGRGCGAVAPTEGITDSACTAAGGTCTQMCFTEKKTCPATDRSGLGYCGVQMGEWVCKNDHSIVCDAAPDPDCPGVDKSCRLRFWCKGGANDKQPCYNFGSNTADCPGGLCSSYNKPCTRTNVSTDPNSCVSFPGLSACYYGEPYWGGWPSPGYAGIPGQYGNCRDFCRDQRWIIYCQDPSGGGAGTCDIPCNGPPVGLCSNFSTNVRFDSGESIVQMTGSGCDCYLSKDEPYLSGGVATPATGALLCTKPLY